MTVILTWVFAPDAGGKEGISSFASLILTKLPGDFWLEGRAKLRLRLSVATIGSCMVVLA